jgi:hypothetical protein
LRSKLSEEEEGLGRRGDKELSSKWIRIVYLRGNEEGADVAKEWEGNVGMRVEREEWKE